VKPNHNPATDSLEARLRAERPLHATGPQFTSDLLRALPSHRSAQRAYPRQRSWIPAVAFGAGVFAFAAVLVSNISNRTPNPGQRISAQVVQPNQEPEASALVFPKLSATEIENLTMKIDEPLDREMKNVVTDTRHAIQFVAANFLPENK
jgi:hypothetical protein